MPRKPAKQRIGIKIRPVPQVKSGPLMREEHRAISEGKFSDIDGQLDIFAELGEAEPCVHGTVTGAPAQE